MRSSARKRDRFKCYSIRLLFGFVISPILLWLVCLQVGGEEPKGSPITEKGITATEGLEIKSWYDLQAQVDELEGVTAREWLTLEGSDSPLGNIAGYLRTRRDLNHDPVDPERTLNMEDLALLLRLSQFLLDEQNALEKRKGAAVAVGFLRHQYAIPPLMAVMRDETQDPKLRAECAEALSYILDRRIVGYLIHEGLTAEEDPLVGATNKALARMVVGPDPPRWPEPPIGQITHQNISDAEIERHVLQWKQWWRKNQRCVELGQNILGYY